MKEIVIKIPDDMYRGIKDDTYCGVLHLTLYDAIKNGTELPKGHGRLIEVTTQLEACLSTFQSYTGIDEAPYEYADELIRNADTVVEADKGE